MTDARVLFLQPQLCGRSWRAAKVLSDAGVSVKLLAMGEPATHMDYSVFETRESLEVGRDIRSMVTNRRAIIKGIRDMVDRHEIDLIHSHNTPDNLSAWAIEHTDVPVVHDVHDLQSLIPVHYGSLVTRPIIRHLQRTWERRACRNADHVIVVSDAQRDLIRDRYEPSHIDIIANKAIQEPAPPTKKRSQDDGHIHIAYAGTFSLTPGNHRHFLPEMERVAKGDIHVHVYPLTFGPDDRDTFERIAAEHPNLHFHEPVPTTHVVRELAQYDYGWLHFPVMTDNIRTASATKLFEYVLAGLPCIVNNEGRIAEFVKRTGCGIAVADVADAVPVLREDHDYPMPVDECHLKADHLTDIYGRVLAARAQR